MQGRSGIQEEVVHLHLEAMNVFIGLLYLHEVLYTKGVKLDSLWTEKWSFWPIFRNTMPSDFFCKLLRCLWYDLKTSRSQDSTQCMGNKRDKFGIQFWIVV